MGFLKKVKDKMNNKILVPATTFLNNGYCSYATDYDKFEKNMYNNPFFSSPLNEIVRSFNNATIGVYRRDRKGNVIKVEGTNVEKWLGNPNPELTQDQYNSYWILWYYIGGGLLMNKTNGVNLKHLYLYRPDTFKINRDNKMRISGIEIGETKITGKNLENYKIVRAVNVSDPIAGMGSDFKSPLTSLAIISDMVEYALVHQNRQLKNSGKRTGILEYKKLLKNETLEEIKRKLQGLGNKSAGTIAMLNGENFKFHPTDITPQEMDWLNSLKFMREVVSSGIGVPIQLISTEGTTYNNTREFKKKFYNDTINPLLELFCNSHNSFLQDDLKEGEFIWYDTSQVDELKMDISEIIQKLAVGLIGQVTMNEFRKIVVDMTGIDLKPLSKNGDILLVKSNLSTIEDLIMDDGAKQDDVNGE